MAVFGEQASGFVVVGGSRRPADAFGDEPQGSQVGLGLARLCGQLTQGEIGDRVEGDLALFGVEQPPSADHDIGGCHHRGGP